MVFGKAAAVLRRQRLRVDCIQGHGVFPRRQRRVDDADALQGDDRVSCCRIFWPGPPSNNTLSGTTTAARPPTFSRLKMCWTKLSCLFAVETQKSCRTTTSSSLSRSPSSFTVFNACFDFLGYTLGRCYSPGTGRAFIGTRPSTKRVKRVFPVIGELTDHKTTWQDTDLRVKRLNRILNGWANYFSLGPVSRAYRAVEQHARRRLLQWLARKHKMRARVKTTFTAQYLHQTLGLVSLGTPKARNLWAGT
jgi:hypothetical protein